MAPLPCLVASVVAGPEHAAHRFQNVTRIATQIVEYKSRAVLFGVAGHDPAQMQLYLEGASAAIRKAREDLRTVRAGVEAAVVEEEKSSTEVNFNPAILQTCVEGARRSAREGALEAAESSEDALRTFEALAIRTSQRAEEVAALVTSRGNMDLLGVRAQGEELKEKLQVRSVATVCRCGCIRTCVCVCVCVCISV